MKKQNFLSNQSPPLSGGALTLLLFFLVLQVQATGVCPYSIKKDCVEDNQPPSITCPASITVNVSPGTCVARVLYPSPVASDDAPPATPAGYTYHSQGGGSYYYLSTTTADYHTARANARAAGGHLAVVTSAAENALLPPPIAWLGGTDELVEGTWVWETFEPFSYTNWSPGEPNNSGNEDGIITWGSNTWNDHKLHIPEKWVLEVEGARFVQTAGLAQNALFPKGTTTNTFVVTDAAGLTNQCSFTITVVDNIPPTITCPPNKTVNADPGSCSATGVVLGNPAASDNCTGLVVTNNGPATYPVGTTTVTHTANDGTNSVTCNQTVTVVDNQLPTITCPTNMMVNVDPGTCGARVIYTSPIASDNCDPATPAGYTYHSQGLGSYYYLSTTTADYHTARANARAAGGHLAVVTSAAENALIPPPIAWLGGMDELVEGTWVWETFEPFIYTNWSPGEPNNSGNEDGIITWGSNTWNDHKLHIPEKWVLEVEGARFVQTAGLAQNAIFPKGTTTNTFVVTDAAGLTNQCSFTITVVDNIAPTVVCKPHTVSLDASGQATIVPANIFQSGSDNCGTVNLQSVSPNSFTCINEGLNQVTLTVNDGNNNTATCTAVVTVQDNIAPSAVCQNATVQLGANGNGSLPAISVSVGPVAGALPNQGDANAPLNTVCDCPAGYVAVGYEGFAGCIIDDFRLICKELMPDGTLGATTAVTCFSSGLSGTSSGAKVLSGNNVMVGATIEDRNYNFSPYRTLKYLNGHGKSIADIIARAVNSTGTIAIASLNGSGCFSNSPVTTSQYAPAGYVITGMYAYHSGANYTNNVAFRYSPIIVSSPLDGGSYDNCGIFSSVASQTSFTCADLGLNNVTLTVYDVHGNTGTCTATVTVIDNENPTITCPAPITVNNDGGQCSAVVSYLVSGTDNCSFTLSQTAGQASGTAFPVGTTNNSFTATDPANNSVGCSFTVTVIDNENPTITCPAPITVNNDGGQCSAVVSYLVSGTDNCSFTLSQTAGQASGTAFPVGTTNNSWTATDPANNAVSCSFTVTVIDNENPTITCPAPITVNNDGGQCSAVVSYSVNGTDNCSFTLSQTAGQASGTAFPVGTTTNSWTATDPANNAVSCSFTVTVIDNENPTITCPAPITVNNDGGQCSAVVSYTVSGSDNCSFLLAQTGGLASGSAFPVGVTTNSWTSTDPSNNSVGCSFTVTVLKSGDPDLLWAYTAIGLDEVKMKKNTVQSGGVGVVNAGKKAKLEHATMVTATNTFVKAPVLDLNGGSQVATYYPGQVSASLLPAFLPYSGTCNNNLNIPDNSGPVTLNLACYKDITVGKNVSVTFSGHATINVKDLKLKEGSSVSFAQNTNLLIEKKLDSDKYVTISNNGNMVWIYVDDHVKIDDGNSITANIYCQKHIHVDKTPVGNPTYMTGLFIAEKIDSKDNVYWNWDASVCPFSTPLMLAGPPSITGPVAEMEEGLLMELFPNPASDDVNIHLHGTESAAMLTIHDQLGRLVWTGQMEAGQIATVINLGDARFGAGIYTVTAVSNGEKMVQRLVIAR